MKHLLKTSALLVVALLAAQPVLASVSCVAGMAPACTPDCPMAMTSMAPDCPMTGMTASGGCPQNCCTRNAVEAVLPQAVPDKFKVTFHIPVAVFSSAAAAAGLENPAAASLQPRADSPPRYILNRVLRI